MRLLRPSRDAAARLGKGLLGPSVIALVFACALAARVGAADGFRYLAPARAGEQYALPAVLLPGQRAERGNGYDGQFYFYLAQDPFLTRPDTARSLDNSFRVRRLLYPLLAWLLALGRRGLVPYSLVAVNVLALTALAALCALAARRAGRSTWWALLPLVYAGTWTPLLLDLTEPLQLALLAGGMLLGSAGLLLGATVAKETAGVALATETVRRALARDWRGAARHAAAAAAFLAWSLGVYWFVRGTHFGTLGAHFLDPPGAPLLNLKVAFPAVAVAVLALLRPLWARDPSAWAGAAYALLCLGAGNDTWTDPAAFFRVTAGALVLVYLSWCERRDLAGLATLAVGAAAGVVTLLAVATA